MAWRAFIRSHAPRVPAHYAGMFSRIMQNESGSGSEVCSRRAR